MEKQQFQLSIAGLGITFYAPHAVRHIEEGEEDRKSTRLNSSH